jgi:hypothetical protein
MRNEEIKEILEYELKKQYLSMGNFVNDNNPQVKELYNRARGGYDAIDEIYFKVFNKYSNIED